MTRDEFVRDWQHEIDGWVLDAAMDGRRGADLSLFLRQMREKIRLKLGSMYDALTPKAPPPTKPAGGLKP